MKSVRRIWILAVVLIVAAGLGWSVFIRLREQANPSGRRTGPQSVPVEVAQIQRGPITLQRTFSGALEATAEFVVAPKVSGRVEPAPLANVIEHITTR